jgi:hypothetical protein
MATLTSTAILPPGAPASAGPKWSVTMYDNLKLPNGQTIGATDNETLRRELMRMGIIGAPTEGRHIIVERYATLLLQIHNDAGDRAVAAWLQSNRG